jgi:hypothetical protein
MSRTATPRSGAGRTRTCPPACRRARRAVPTERHRRALPLRGGVQPGECRAATTGSAYSRRGQGPRVDPSGIQPLGNVRTESRAEDYRAGAVGDELGDLYDLTLEQVDADPLRADRCCQARGLTVPRAGSGRSDRARSAGSLFPYVPGNGKRPSKGPLTCMFLWAILGLNIRERGLPRDLLERPILR